MGRETGEDRAETAHSWGALARDLEDAHRRASDAADAGIADPALGPLRLSGAGVAVLADAAVTSATPFLRPPLLARIGAAARLHQAPPEDPGECPTCRLPAPCPTARALLG